MFDSVRTVNGRNVCDNCYTPPKKRIVLPTKERSKLIQGTMAEMRKQYGVPDYLPFYYEWIKTVMSD